MEKFAPDRDAVGALWMKILRSPHPHARIKGINTTRVLALPGVEAVVTHEDAPRKEIRCRIFNWKGRVLDSRVRFIGEEVAAVAAETEAIASKALDLIEVEYEVLPAVFDMEEALKPGAPDVSGVGTNKVSCPPEPSTRLSFQKWGDVEEGFAKASAIVEHETRTQRVYGSFFPPACIAEWEGDKLTVMLSHQCPYNVRSSTAEVFDMTEHKVRIIAPLVAATQGMLNSSQRFWNIAALLSRKSGRPVIYKMTIEEYGVYKSREADIMRVKMGGEKDGTVTALDYWQVHDNGGYGWKTAVCLSGHEIFREASVIYNAYGACTNKFSTGCNRSPGNTPQTISLNQTFDMLLERLGLDPVPAWKKNHFRTGDPVSRRGAAGRTLSSEAYDELIDKGAEAIGWKEKWRG
ncbi:MAG: molybdopterin cofactor-binding domain-containing protein, partial [Chloroflexota bacterium]